MPPPSRPISPAFFSIWAIRCSSLWASSSGTAGITSFWTNSSAVWPIRRWSSEKSAGVKTSSGRQEVIRNAPPRLRVWETGAVAIYASEGWDEPLGFSRAFSICTIGLRLSRRCQGWGGLMKRELLIDRYIFLDMCNVQWWNARMNVAANATTAPERAASWDLVADMSRASALLHPLRLRILDALREPDSASGLARRFRLPRQKMNYHVRELARAHFLERAGQRRRRNMIERRYRTTARGYVLSPELLGRMGVPREHAEVARASREAAAQRKRLTTLSVSSELRFESAEQRAKFARELRRSMIEVIGRYASPHTMADGSAGAGRPYRLILGCYPIPPKIAANNSSGGA